MKRLFDYFGAAYAELVKVSWPSRRQTLRLTIVVIIFSLVFAFGLGAVDYIFSTILQKVILKG